MFIKGLALAGYRSFGADIQRIAPLAKVNLLIGPNNSGKSNILRFLHEHYDWNCRIAGTVGQSKSTYTSLDNHIGTLPPNSVLFGNAIDVSGEEFKQLIANSAQVTRSDADFIRKKLIDLCTSGGLIDQTSNLLWLYYRADSLGQEYKIDVTTWSPAFLHDADRREHEWRTVWTACTNTTGGTLRQNCLPDVFQLMRPGRFRRPAIHMIPAVRRIGEKGSSAQDFSGLGIIDRLARLQNPSHDEQLKKSQFDKINTFVRNVTGNPSATIEIPYDRDMINVHMDQRTLPLSSLGTGIHEVIILASAATVTNDAVLCIEEPELHLHPVLQKKLLQYLQDTTTNQYFITSHSAHLLDCPDVSVFHIRHDGKQTHVAPAITPFALHGICQDLGYRPSDLLQTNCIIWVEGPSDRIYVNHWIKALAPNLMEGVHYSIMFYGGRLLSHLSATDPCVQEFISLRRLNRNAVIVCDSDQRNRNTVLNDTKKRIIDEFTNTPGFAWITQGREIENYIAPSVMEAAIKSIHTDVGSYPRQTRFTHALEYRSATHSRKVAADKIKIAKHVATKPAQFDILDLRERMSQVVEFIKRVNAP